MPAGVRALSVCGGDGSQPREGVGSGKAELGGLRL
jgi:hypothetical protein